MEYNILVGGAAGQGIDTVASILAKTLKRCGFFVFVTKDYMSRVRGGHNFTQIRFGSKEIYSHSPELDVIYALDSSTIEHHSKRLKSSGTIIYDQAFELSHPQGIELTLNQTAKAIGDLKLAGVIGVGAILRLFDVSLEIAKAVVMDKLASKDVEQNIEALVQGYHLVQPKYLTQSSPMDNNILIDGNQAIALGALAGGISFYAAYPMAPSTGIMKYLYDKQDKANIFVEQAEDEISAINMAIGASYAGVRAMTGTSGGGFSLMVEALGLSAVAEIPLVIANVQRPGPATGLATRTEQSDLSFVLSASQGDMPRMVMAVKTVEDCFYQTCRAMNIADKYRMPVILLSDQYLADSSQSIPPFNLESVSIDRYMETGEGLRDERYKYYDLDHSKQYPRLIPGKIPGYVILADSHEHDEYGNISEDINIRVAMMEKRMGKLEELDQELQEPDYVGVEHPDILLIAWGSTYGAIREGVEALVAEGIAVGALIFGDLYPLPTKLLGKYSKEAFLVINLEQNYSGQLAKLISQETGIRCHKSILKYDGRQMDGNWVYTRVKEMME